MKIKKKLRILVRVLLLSIIIIFGLFTITGKIPPVTEDPCTILITGEITNAEILYQDVITGNERKGSVPISVIHNNGKCEFRLEYKPSYPIDWPISEISTGLPGIQRHIIDCYCPSFTVSKAANAKQFEEQTTYYWIMRARAYAMQNLWITPDGWEGNPPSHANDGVDVDVLEKDNFDNACLPRPTSGCFRAWPIIGPEIHLKAGSVKPELIVHEFGHYACGFVFGHMPAEFWFLDACSLSFQEAIAEIYMDLFFHNERYIEFKAEDPLLSGKPSSGSGFHSEDADVWQGCGNISSEYVIARPLVQAFHQSLWDDVWPDKNTANHVMISAFSTALAKMNNMDIEDMAEYMLDYINITQESPIREKVISIFKDHGFSPSKDLNIIELNFEPLNSNSWNPTCYNADLLYSNVKLFKPIIKLDRPAPIDFKITFAILEDGQYSDPNIGVFIAEIKKGTKSPLVINTPNTESVVEELMNMNVNRMPTGAPSIETKGFWLGCTKKCIIRGNGPMGLPGKVNVYIKTYPLDPEYANKINLQGENVSPMHEVECN